MEMPEGWNRLEVLSKIELEVNKLDLDPDSRYMSEAASHLKEMTQVLDKVAKELPDCYPEILNVLNNFRNWK